MALIMFLHRMQFSRFRAGLNGSSFDGSKKSHREQMWKGRVALFFTCTFKKSGPGQHEPIPCVLALVNRFRQFTAPQARKLPSSLTELSRADRISIVQRGCFKNLACPCFTTVILPLTFVSFPCQRSLRGLVWPRSFSMECLSIIPSRIGFTTPCDSTLKEVRQTQRRQPAGGASCMR